MVWYGLNMNLNGTTDRQTRQESEIPRTLGDRAGDITHSLILDIAYFIISHDIKHFTPEESQFSSAVS